MEQIEFDDTSKKIIAMIDEEQGKKSIVAWNMLEHNSLEGVFPIHYYYVDNKACFQYMTEGYTRVSDYFQKKKGGFETVYFLCCKILAILEEGQEYLLEPREFLIEEKWIFWNRQEKKVKLCYLPGREGSGEKEFTTLVEKLLQVVDYQDKKGVEFVYGLYDYIQSDGFTTEGVSAFIRQFHAEPELPSCENAQTDRLNVTKQAHEMREAENAVCKKEMLLVFDSQKSVKEVACFSGYFEGLNYSLSKEKLVVGRSRLCDVILPFGAVSAKHALISRQKDIYFLRDMQSLNGVYLNGERVTDYEKKALKAGDSVSFGGICFTITEKGQDLSGIPA